MNPFDSLAKLAVGFIHEGIMQRWFKLAASLAATAFVAFFGTLGLTVAAQVGGGIEPMRAFILALGYASLVMSLSVLNLCLRSPLTKNIAILYSGRIEAERIKELTNEGIVYQPNEKR